MFDPATWILIAKIAFAGSVALSGAAILSAADEEAFRATLDDARDQPADGESVFHDNAGAA